MTHNEGTGDEDAKATAEIIATVLEAAQEDIRKEKESASGAAASAFDRACEIVARRRRDLLHEMGL